MWSCITDFFTYETTKSVVVKSWTIGIINRVVQLLIITYFIGWVFLTEKAYQIRDTAIESSVMTKVKGFGIYNNKVMDVADYVTPTQGASVFCIITKLITTENQVQGYCPDSEKRKFLCTDDRNCTKHINKPASYGIATGRCVPFNAMIKTCEIKGWCPAEIDTIKPTPMMETENFTIFIKNSIRFPTFNYTKGNFLPNITKKYISECNFDMVNNTYCPIFRVGDVVRYAQQNFTNLAEHGGVIGIKIGWMCDLDKSDDHCNPSYSFTRLDAMSQNNTVSPGYNFRFAKYFKMENGTDYRTLVKAYAIRFDVLVNGNAGKFNMIPTLINMVAAFTSVGVGTVLCDIILLNFLKGAEQYKAKKFEEVSDNPSEGNGLYRSQLSLRQTMTKSNDSGAFSIEPYS
ncbi:P2X purinoceptor 3b [Maylandia zebra]|uniref:P2X purinoceptor n=1 Tax=Astatotilapia calliptera TaxID=8154 RepID=A0AAX7U580_ASTCA|nr:P2X purinoceptor 3b [Haplochromis burtoni]XP_014186741.1 P2X purinoceptor 3 isoform X2 [Haplochromis burtoni]XP_024655809.1 P2X purinoceptor 3 [Maylandia zebra]XP_026027935.1 P2X purinoceptor 3-like [Astatotilapia calliptera]XP_026027936.1 P2X purinoceptor 3-like [Astatotilapia calliptera]